ncbi:hypothetical protein M408DRAFT_28069 [Serendipita vermifera MAFF 305830]|uniref:F-box domain-containing protein n=1 Tax=Serendipita vermifera MAFF 305830 TaxID=933852 RepID=A0A0C2WA18_SERVB|nr:hypothetical protein M408DRAFT_28069 [Serendipita vermifera MAFF 305830]
MDIGHYNKKLTSDVLGHIFSCYADEETVFHSLETLLLVCRSWNQAALGHRSLWSRFKIYLGHYPTSQIWTNRLPSRLEKCGPKTPLDIDLRNLLEGAYHTKETSNDPLYNGLSCGRENPDIIGCPCYDAIQACVSQSLKILAGSNGLLGGRLRSIALDLGASHSLQQTPNAAMIELRNLFRWPTPELRSLVLKNIFDYRTTKNSDLFPDTAKVERIILHQCFLPSYPDCANAKDASIGWDPYNFTGPRAIPSLRGALNLRSLSLNASTQPVSIPAELNELRTLQIHWSHLPSNLSICHMPKVSTLHISCDNEEIITQVLNCQGLDFKQLERITITRKSFFRKIEMDYVAYLHAICQLLVKAQNARYLEADASTMCIILKVLWNSRNGKPNVETNAAENNARPLFTDGWLINRRSQETSRIRERSSKAFIENLAESWGCISPSLTESQFLKDLAFFRRLCEVIDGSGWAAIMNLRHNTEKLPFDVLGRIFSYYVDEETIFHSLETLLLVCRSWDQAALGHRSLWSRFKIYLGHYPTSQIWKKRLPSRLEKCGRKISLDIDLRNMLEGAEAPTDTHNIDIYHPRTCSETNDGPRECACYDAARLCIYQSLQTLTGNNGSICNRWRSLSLDLGWRSTPGMALNFALTELSNAFRFPTPHLTSLILKNVYAHSNFGEGYRFPDTTHLERIILINTYLPLYPDCENVKEATIGWDQYILADNVVEPSLRKAARLQFLSLHATTTSILLPPQLNELQTLELHAWDVSNALKVCHMPAVSTLHMVYESNDLIERVSTYQGFKFEQLKRNLRYIEADTPTMCMILKEMWNSRCDTIDGSHTPENHTGPLFADGWLINSTHNENIRVDETCTSIFIETLATRWKCLPPNTSDSQFLEQLVGLSVLVVTAAYILKMETI